MTGRKSFTFQRTIIIIILVLFTFSLQAQQANQIFNGSISGRIIDSLSRVPVEFATISIFYQENGKLINGTSSDSKGEFELSGLDNGTYKIVINFIGYQTYSKSNIVVNKKQHMVKLGDIFLTVVSTALQEVTVTSVKSLVENKVDKLVYNADKDITSQGGVATDMLKKIPQVDVDVNGNVELQGNANILFLINGKPSTVFGNNITDVLQSIPASQIQSIEVVTNPGAKYDAEGGGVINIILKKSKQQGYNGNVSFSGGTRLENGSLNLNARKGSFGVNAFFSGNAQLPSITNNSLNNLSLDTAVNLKSAIIQNGTGNFYRIGYQTGINIDWDITPKNNITASVSYNFFENSNVGSLSQQSFLQDAYGNTFSNVYNSIITESKFHFHSVDMNLNYKKTFNQEGQELVAFINSSHGNNYNYYKQVDQIASSGVYSSGSYGNNPGTDNQNNITVNYSQPFYNKVIKMETGAKVSQEKVISSSEVYLLDLSSNNYDYSTSQSNLFNYSSYIYACYLSATFKLFKYLDIIAGCRDEYTVPRANLSGSETINLNSYNNLVPSFVISHVIDKTQAIKFSYTHRISRPKYRDINPFINASNPVSISTGNPNLNPELSDQLELGYNMNIDKGPNVNFSVFYRGIRNDIEYYTTYLPTLIISDSTYSNVAFKKPENIGLEASYGVNLYVSIPVTSKINLRSNLSCLQRYIITDLPGGSLQGFMYRANLNASYQVSDHLIIELFGVYSSPKVQAQGTLPAFYFYNFALRQQLFHKKLSIAITATNAFNKYINQVTNLNGNDFTSKSTTELPFRSFGININYKFGKMEFKKQPDIENINLPNPNEQGN